MDINKAIDIAILTLVIVLAAVLTYFMLAKIIAPPSRLHSGVTIITSTYEGINAWPPYFQLINSSVVYNTFKNYSLVYGPNTAPIKVLILYNPVMPPATNFTVTNANYIINTSEEGLVQYEIAFNVYSYMSAMSASPLTTAETNVASVAYCLYFNSTNSDNALLFLSEVGSIIGSNTSNVANFTSTASIQEILNKLGININATECVNKYETYVMNYQRLIGYVLVLYYVPPFLTPTPLTYEIPINSPVLFMLGYNSMTGAYDDTINNIQLPIFVQNLMTQKFIYQNLNG
ncbi:MAG: hypothetical protein ACP5GZ_04085 [Vulcanisaeta sp.]|uniref:hypothetical protein n=1 Tax=Vulcanisaeta sp. TaxID=2020871 RepID=UPI003D0B74FE